MDDFITSDALFAAFAIESRMASLEERGFILRVQERARQMEADAPKCTICECGVLGGDAFTIQEADGTRGRLFAHQRCFLRQRCRELEAVCAARDPSLLLHVFAAEVRPRSPQ